MKIKKVTATFGNLKNDTLKLSDGLNIIHAPNESGKSTWCAFMRIMLYGINTADRDKTGYLSDKNRYRPWSGDAMSGTMEIEHEGAQITLERSALGSVPMKKFSAVYTGTGEAVPDINGMNAGERLTGVTESVFERTAFIRQAGVHIDQTNELEKRIASIVSSGDEQQSYSETDAKLRAWQRKLKYNRSGIIPQLETELAEAEQQYEKIQSAADGISDMRQEAERLKALRAQLEDDLKTIDRLEIRAEARTVWNAKNKAEEKQKELNELKKVLTVNGRILTRDDTGALREACASLPALEEMTEKARNAERAAAAASENAEKAKAASKLFPMSPAEASEKAARASELESSAAEARAKLMPKKTGTVIFAVAAALLVCAVLALVLLHDPLIAAAAALIAVAAAAFAVIKSHNRDDSGERLSKLLGETGFDDAASLKTACDEYASLCAAAEKAATDHAAASQSLDSASAALDTAKATALSKIKLIMPGISDASAAGAYISRIEELIDRLAKTEFEAAAAKNTFDSLLARCGGVMPELDEEYISAPIRNREDTRAYLERTRTQLELQNEKYNLAAGRLKALGDPAIIGSRIKQLRESLGECNEKYEALALAISVLGESNTEISTRFSPLISAKAGEIMGRLTDGKYESLVFDRSFYAQAKETGRSVSHSALSLSTGANDQLYLALRLAMCETVLPKDEPCPVILDDALVNLDDRRTSAALNELLHIAEKRQVILFTCHDREGKLMKDAENVNVISVEKF